LTKRRTRIVNSAPNTTAWLTLGFALFVAWRLIRLVRFWLRKNGLRRSPDLTGIYPAAEQVARRCRATLRIRKVELAQSSSTRVPYTIGALRPLIVLPQIFCVVSEERLLSVIGHEMAHVARRDYLTNLICELALLPISFHPLAYIIKKQIDRNRELACDELVSKLLLPPKLYARTLVWAAHHSREALNHGRAEALILSMFDARSLEERVMRLTRNRKTLNRSLARAITLLTLFALCAAAVSLSLFSLELKTEARAVFTPPALVTTTNTVPQVSQAETITPQHPRAEARPAQAASDAQTTEARAVDENAAQRAAAACEAGRNNDLEKIPELIALLADDTKTPLLRCWSSGRWSPALETFKHPSPGEQAAIALASMGRTAFQPLANQLDSADATVRRNAAWAIAELTNMTPGERDAAVPRLIALLTDSDAWVRIAAARALGEVRNHSAVPALIATLADADAHVRELAVWALSELKDKRAVAALCNVLLSDSRPDVRRGAAEALGEIRSTEALPALKQALNDPNVNARAQWAISEI
jgi:HEAT repeat protein